MSEAANASVDRKTISKVLVGFVLAAIVLYLFGRVIGWSEILNTLRNANPLWIAAACGSSLLCLLVWSRSWDVILDLLGVDIPWRSLVPTYYAATFADYVTPFGKAGGSPFIAYVLSTDDRANYQESLAGVITADLLNLLPFFTFAGVGFVALLVQSRIPNSARGLITGLAVLAIAMPLFVYLSYHKRDFVEGLVVKVTGPISANMESELGSLTSRPTRQGVSVRFRRVRPPSNRRQGEARVPLQSRAGTSRSARYSLTPRIEYSPKWKMEAASAASAPASVNTS
jgi:uncharacterized protein (TIRG00374 family)